MNIKFLVAAALIAVAALPCGARPRKASKAPQPDTAFVFTDVVTLPHTSVKDQNKSGTCWCFSAISFFEDEMLRKGADSLDLSEMWVVRQCYLDKADRYVRLYGQTNFAAGGSSADVPYVWQRYGVVPEQAYPGLQYGEKKHVHGELDAVLSAYLKAIVANPNKKLSSAWRKGYEGILDAYLGAEPKEFVVDGKTYTPQSYAASLPLDMDDYVSLTSFAHHPFYEAFAIEVPDNWLNAQSVNLPLDELVEVVDTALTRGYPVIWGADVSEDGFKWNKGFAVIPRERTEADMEGTELSRWVHLSDKERKEQAADIKGPVEEMEITQQLRQEMFDDQRTTDDHGMELVGIATDQKGNRYYKVRNSWDTNQLYDGFFYVSIPYFKAKTMNVELNREAIPQAIASKIKAAK